MSGSAGPGPTSLARDGALNLAGAIVTQLCNVGVVFAIATVLGTAALGQYSTAFSWRAVLLLLCGLGMRVAMTKFVAASIATGDDAGLHGSVRLGLWSTGVLSVAVAVGLFLAADQVAGLLREPIPGDLFRIVALSLPFFVVMTTALAATQGFSTMRAFAGIGLIGEPALRLVLTLGALVAGLGIIGAMWGLAVASIAAGVAAVVALRRLLVTRPSERVELRVRELASFGATSWVASIANQGLLWADIIILGWFVSQADVGVYQVATRVVLLALVVVTPLTASVAPRVTDLWERGLRDQLAARYVEVTSWTWRLSLPVLALVAAVPDQVLRIFGEGFTSGRTTALLLLAGAMVETLAAPSAVVLNQIGRNGLNMVVNLAALAINVVGNLLLVPRIGIAGAALAWTIALLLPGIVRVVAVERIATGRWPWSRQHTAALAAGVAATAAARGLVGLVALPWWGDLLLAGVVVVAVYLLVGVLLGGVTPQELAVVVRRLPRGEQLLQRLRTRGLAEPARDPRLRELISPHRLDVLVRAGLFELARAHRDLVERDPVGFVELARGSDYHTWFREVAVHAMGLDPGDTRTLEERFEVRVRRSLDLLAAWESRGGFDERFPVTVQLLAAGDELDGRVHAADRLVPVDGGHRLALAWLDGHDRLPASWFRIDPDGDLRGNTSRLVAAMGWTPEEHARFLAMGLLRNRSLARSVSSVDDLVDALHEEGSAEADAVARWPEVAGGLPDRRPGGPRDDEGAARR